MAQITEEQVLIAQLTCQLIIAKKPDIPIKGITLEDIREAKNNAINMVKEAKDVKEI